MRRINFCQNVLQMDLVVKFLQYFTNKAQIFFSKLHHIGYWSTVKDI